MTYKQACAALERPTFKLGDKVEWFTPSRDVVRIDIRHAGTVVGVLPANTPLFEVPMEETYWLRRLPADRSSTRDHESYVVFVPPATPGSWGKLCWPSVSGLRKVGA